MMRLLRINLILVLTAGLLILAPMQGSPNLKNLGAQPEVPQNSVKILTLNVMQKAAESRKSRFKRIADFLTGEPVHLLALQELSGGWLDETSTKDSGADLAGLLSAGQLPQGYYTAPVFGYPGLLVFKVGVVTPYKMPVTASGSTGLPQEGVWFPGRKNVVLGGVDIPGFGRINLYSVHIYISSREGKEEQIDNLLSFVNETDAANPPLASVIAGDLNFSPDSHPRAYQKLIDQGFIDSFAALHCPAAPTGCTPNGGTFGVIGNPFTRKANPAPARIDFIFVRGDKIKVKQSKVIFNEAGNFVSDHCGVLTEIAK